MPDDKPWFQQVQERRERGERAAALAEQHKLRLLGHSIRRGYEGECWEETTIDWTAVADLLDKAVPSWDDPGAEAVCESPLLKQVLDALRIGKVACEWAGDHALAQQVADAYDAARELAAGVPTVDPMFCNRCGRTRQESGCAADAGSGAAENCPFGVRVPDGGQR